MVLYFFINMLPNTSMIIIRGRKVMSLNISRIFIKLHQSFLFTTSLIPARFALAGTKIVFLIL